MSAKKRTQPISNRLRGIRARYAMILKGARIAGMRIPAHQDEFYNLKPFKVAGRQGGDST